MCPGGKNIVSGHHDMINKKMFIIFENAFFFDPLLI